MLARNLGNFESNLCQALEASMVCQQMGHGGAATTNAICFNPEASDSFLRYFSCSSTASSTLDCYYEARDGCDQECDGKPDTERKHATVSCSSANCSDWEIRLVGGSTNREGRVEVCVDGRWRAVCGDGWNQEQAGLLCSKLGHLTYGAEIRAFYPRRVPTLNCSTIRERGTLDLMCDNESHCNEDLGVECLASQLLEEILGSEHSKMNVHAGMCSAEGGVIAVLVIVLVVLVTGWSLSCVGLVKRNSHSQKQTQLSQTNRSDHEERQLDNPVYASNMETHNYSSSGPTYELIDTNKGAGQTYSALKQCQENRAKPAKTTEENEEHYYHVLESGECEGVTQGGGNHKVSVSGQTHSQVKLCGEEYSTIK